MTTETFTIQMTFTEKVLGSQPGDRELLAKHIASRAPEPEQTNEEVATFNAKEEFEKGSTVFARDEGGRFYWNYQVLGFFKETLAMLIELGEVKKLSKWLCKRAVAGTVAVSPRRIYINGPDGQPFRDEVPFLQRSLRAETLQGDRIAIASSEVLPVGSRMRFQVSLLLGGNSKSKVAVIEKQNLLDCFTYAGPRGFGQWRSGGYGTFEWKVVEE